MGKTSSIDQFQRDPMRALREVQAGESVTISQPGEPIADVAMRSEPRWIPAEELNKLLREFEPDEEWAQEIAELRAGEDMTDPWD